MTNENEINTANEGYLTITYDVNGGTPEIPSASVYEGGMYILPTIYPQKDGYVFVYWRDELSNMICSPGERITVEKALNFKAVFYRISSITFDLNGGEGDFPVWSEMDTIFITLPENVPTRTGYRFLHWVNLDGEIYEAGGTYIIKPTDDTLTAEWYELKLCTITYDVDGGTPEIPSASVYEGESYTVPDIYTKKDGYQFVYWYDEANKFSITPNETFTVEKSLNFKAVFYRISSITFDLNGGEGDFPVWSEMDTIFITLPENVPTRTGYRFLHWVNLDGEIYEAGGTYIMKPTDDTLTAEWYELKLCTITYDVDGGTPEIPSASVYEGEEYTLSNVEPEKEKHFFTGWVDKDNPNGEMYFPSNIYVIEKNLSLKACFRRFYTIVYDVNGGNETIEDGFAPAEFYYFITSIIPTKERHTFLHWVDEEGNIYNSNNKFIPTNDMTLTAVWKENEIYTITYDVDGGTPEISSASVSEGESHTVPDIYPEKDGYQFVYWYDEANNFSITPNETFTVEKSLNLKAVFYRISSITFDLNGGEGDFPVLSEMDTIFITLPEAVPTKPGHRFLHWVNLDGEIYEAGGTYIMKPTDDTLTAVWQELKLCTITYDVDGGTPEIPSASVYEGESYTVSDVIPQKEGCYFTYWKDSETAAGYTPKESFIISKGITLKAVWTPNPYLVTYDAGEEQPFHSEYVEVGMSTSVISCVPEKEGYSFLNWSDGNGDTYVSGDSFTPASDTKLTAVWSCTLHFDLDGGVGENVSVTKEEGDYIVLSDIPTREGYDFDGFKNKNGEYYSRYVFNKGEDTLRALWREKKYPVTYDLNGGEGSFPEQEKRHTEPLTLHVGVPTKEGTKFFAWESDDGRRFSPNDVYNTNEALHLTAVWENEVTYTVTYDLAGGEGEFSEQIKTHGIDLTLHEGTPTREGYAFLHWLDENGKIHAPEEVYFENENLHLTAAWGIVGESYTITYIGGDGKVFATQVKPQGQAITLYESVPLKNGYLFYRWMVSDTFEEFEAGAEFNIDANVTLKPIWYKLYSLSYYDHNGELITYDEKYFQRTIRITSLIPEREGFEFVCWKSRERGEYYVSGENYTRNEAVNFDAVWVEAEKKKITYDLGEGEGDFPEQVANKSESITLHLNEPEKEGYIFEGWKEKVATVDEVQTYSLRTVTSVEGSSIYESGAVYEGDSSMILGAVWRKSDFAIVNKPKKNFLTLDKLTHQLNVQISSSLPEATITWSSSKPSVAIVDSNGMITLKTRGKTTITATATFNDDGDVYAVEDSFELYIPTFMFAYKVDVDDINVKLKALEKMDEYHLEEEEVRAVADGDNSECNTCIFAFEGLGEGYGSKTGFHTNGFLKSMMVVTKGRNIVYVTRRASTLPDLPPTRKDEGYSMATVKTGIYNYKTGYHGNPTYDAKNNLGENKNSGYVALVPNLAFNDLWRAWYKDKTVGFYCYSCDAINLHATGYTPVTEANIKNAHSRGCQGVSITNYIDFGKAVGFIKNTFGKAPAETGYSGSLNSMLAPKHKMHNYIEVKYILDRSEDEKNTLLSDTGTFYPTFHDCNDLCIN